MGTNGINIWGKRTKKIRPEMGRINSYEIYSENYSALASSAFASSAAGASTGASAFGVLAMFSS